MLGRKNKRSHEKKGKEVVQITGPRIWTKLVIRSLEFPNIVESTVISL